MPKFISFMLAALVGIAAIGLTPSPAHATLIPLTASLDGAQNVPSLVTAGTGSATMSFDDVTNLFSWNITWIDLTGAAVATHFHDGDVGFNGPVLFSVGTTSPEIGSQNLTAAIAADLLTEGVYINIHTIANRGGEIRGQVLLQIPEPATIGLFAIGLAGLGVMTRRRRKQIQAA